MSFLKRYPRLSSIIVGFTLGLIVAIANGYYANATISEYKTLVKEREKRYEELLEKSHIEITSLQKTNETLKQHIKTRKVTKPDGTVVEETDTDTDRNTVTETEIRKTIEIEYERKLRIETEKYNAEINTLIHRKLRVGFGMNTNLNYYGHGAYNIWNNISLGGGMSSDGTVMLDIGISL